MDLKDARYVFRSKWVDLDIACSIFKNRKAILERSASESVDYQSIDQYGDEAMDQQELSLELNGASTTSDRLTGYHRRRVRITKAWITIPTNCDKTSGGTFTGEIYDGVADFFGLLPRALERESLIDRVKIFLGNVFEGRRSAEASCYRMTWGLTLRISLELRRQYQETNASRQSTRDGGPKR
ncbi:hypothetical protein FJ872_32110 [Mesorhizobium sp. B2-5-9]|uniref:portal protein n=1 Tax=Mesorhizobium sp. B2-5-9 TaxID=2589921 RepID=UPI00112DDF6A|nr:hypothetical protein [Mesorhizobium sp. B2-5-9]TPJ97424.1 hypothetical protein FJ872_32110 [Mesorhizobium sp. B2-5-9]